MTVQPRTLVDGLVFAEGPRWRDGRLFFSDMLAERVFAVEEDGGLQPIAEVPGRPSGLGWLPDGRLMIVSMQTRELLVRDDDLLQPYANLEAVATGPLNDMVVDPCGRAYVGCFGFDLDAGAAPRSAALALVTPDGRVVEAARDMMFANGCVVTPDAKTLIVAETFAGRLTAFDVSSDGTLSRRRVWAELPGAPDGICLDAEGYVWCAMPLPPGGFLRVAEGGTVVSRIELREGGGTACALGGADGHTLFLLEALTTRAADCRPGNARIRAVKVDVPAPSP